MIKPSIISKNISLVSGTQNISFEKKYDFAILVGYHGMEGRPGVFSHTYRFDFKEITANGIPIGEVEIICRWLGSYSIPVVLVIGDYEAIYESNFFNPYRVACCVKSHYCYENIDKQHLLNKAVYALEAALKLDLALCVSHDTDSVAVEFYNPDIVSMLTDYDAFENKLIFKNCAHLEGSIDALINCVNTVTEKILKTNTVFLNTLRQKVKNFSKDDLLDLNINHLLTKNRAFLDRASRNEITIAIDDLINKKIKKTCKH